MRVALAKNRLQPWKVRSWCLKTEPDSDFVCHMEEVTGYLPAPLGPPTSGGVCGRSPPSSCHQDGAGTASAWPRPGHTGPPAMRLRVPAQQAQANLFMITAPFVGWRHVEVTARRTKLDFAQILQDLVDVHFPQAPRITLVCDKAQHAQTRRPVRALMRPPRPGASPAAWSGCTPPGMPAGSTSRRSRSMPSNARPVRPAGPRRGDGLRTQVTAWAKQRNQLGAPCSGASRLTTPASNCSPQIMPQGQPHPTSGLSC